jgi:hypothetical protein
MAEGSFNDPRVEQYLRRMGDRQKRTETQISTIVEHYNELKNSYESSQMELKRLQSALKKTAERIRYIEDIPGKRVPYFMNFEIAVPGPDNPTFTVVGQRLADVKQVSMDGPFVCTSYLSAFRMKTYSLGAYTFGESIKPMPAAGTELITSLTGRLRPVASTADPFAGAYIGPGVGDQTLLDASLVNTFRPGSVDFLYEISDEGTDRQRQNQVPSPSRYLFSENDRPLYLPVSDFFERGSSLKIQISMLHDLGYAEINATSFAPNSGGQYADSSIPGNAIPSGAAQPDGPGRVVVGLGGTLTFTMLGYKILQAQSPAV